MVQTENGYQPAKQLAQRLKSYKTFYDPEEAERLGIDDDTLVTPPTTYGHRIRFKVRGKQGLIEAIITTKR